MSAAPIPQNESQRLKALRSYHILDSLPQKAFDDLTKIAAQICDMPIALISLIDEDRQWFKSKVGLEDEQTSRESAFCAHAINQPDRVMEIPNALEDSRVSDSPLVLQQPAFRFYAGAPLITPEGYALGTLCVLDVAPRKLTKQQLEALEALSRQVMSQMELNKKISQLDEARAKAEAASRAKEQFLSSMSHEIRTPLNAIVGTTYLLLSENPRPDQLEDLNILKFSSENLMGLVNDILDISKIESGRVALEATPLAFKQLVSSIHASHAIRAEANGIDLFAEVDPNIPHSLLGDSVRIAQVFNNLVGNAVKFTEKGSVTMNVQLVTLIENVAKIHVAIQDTGIGIAKDKIEQIFERFSQADASITRRFGGSGLGLFITKRLLDLMGSEIKIESQPDQGTTFSFDLSLPVAEHEARLEEHSTSNSDPLLGSDHSIPGAVVLVVDDNTTNQVIVRKYLIKWGIAVETASNGKEALEKVRAKEYDLVLMDIQMPIMDGYTAAAEIRKLDGVHFQKLPIVALTASALRDVKQKVYKSGMNDFVSKPFTPTELWSKLNGLLGKSAKKMAPMKDALNEMAEGDEDFFKELADAYLSNLEEFLASGILALEKGDADSFDQALHKVKPSLITLQIADSYEGLSKLRDKLKLQVDTIEAEDLKWFASMCNQAIRQLKQIS